jgi:hypothetical protein
MLVVSAAVMVGLAGGCRWEVSKVPLPRPSPTPTPSPSPSPSIQFTEAESATTLRSGAEQSLASRVAAANADLITSASSTAATDAASFERAARRAAVAPASAAGELSTAMESYASTKRSYHRAEAAVFYVDPDSTDELSAQPDPLGAGAVVPIVDAFAEIDTKLEKLARLTADGIDEDSIGEVLGILPDLAGWSGRLRSDMEAIARAWNPGVPDNFRQRYFLAAPEFAMARIFQGLLAQSGDVLPARRLGGVIRPAEVTGRTAALRDLYLGVTEESPAGEGLHDYVYVAAPAQAMATYGAIAQAAALAEALALAPRNEETRRQLLGALDNVTRQLELSAAAVGIRIVEATD